MVAFKKISCTKNFIDEQKDDKDWVEKGTYDK